MPIVHNDPGQPIETPGGMCSAALATPSRGATGVSVIRQRQQPGGANPDHTHDREEVLVLLAGEVTVRSGDETYTLRAGDSLIVPPGTPHAVTNPGSIPAEWLIVAQAGVRFFHATGEEALPAWAQ
jgi:quercetin dioxygenase-like cupin family protein